MTLPLAALFGVLTLCASLSSLLTFAHLWQVKEWRFDRLREHLRAKGWYGQLLGTLRPPLIAILLVFSGFDLYGTMTGELAGLLVLSSLSIAQIGLRKQPMPVWTSKAKAIVTMGAALACVDAICILLFANVFGWNMAWILLTLPLFASLYILAAWCLLWPLDMLLKRNVLRRAERLRERHPNLRVIGITGSVGKTTVKELLSHVLKDQGAWTTPEHVNTEMGVAGWLSSVLSKEPEESGRVLIIEMGAYRKGEIALLCRIARPTIGIITYVGDQHLSLFGSREAIIEGKGELFEALPPHGKAFGNSDNDAFAKLKVKSRAPVTAVGTGQHADIQATDVEETPNGLTFRTLGTTFTVPLSGTHTVTGILLAAAAAAHLGMKPQDIARELQSFTRPAKTFEVKSLGATTVLDDTYNSSPDSVRAAIDWAAGQPHRQKILVIEGIIELGQAEEKIHKAIAEKADPVFDEIYVGDPHFLPFFRDVLGDKARLASERTHPVEDGALLALVGRLPKSITKLFLS